MSALPFYHKRNSMDENTREPASYWMIEAHQLSPMIKYMEEKNIINIQGESTGAKSLQVLKETAKMAQEHLDKNDSLKVIIHVNHLSGYAIAGILQLLAVMQVASQKGKNVSVKWYWDRRNQENVNEALSFSKLFNFPFYLIVT